ncbi:MAG: zf-HC2 domain-containing protein [Pyrinomonadaceae bacterium MAG19_C2-C3]|nr:zf-HC2 domain-containing protein [Pyrinomonadaceae bacterium MAG19_C2-C3]
MFCEQFEERLTDYLEGVLTAGVRVECNEHVLRCPVCHDLLNEVRGTVELCRTAPLPVNPPPALEARLLAHTAPETLMTCDEFEARLTDYLDGFLPATLFHRWERHAALCAGCSELPGTVVRSIGACYSSLSDELPMPAHLHDAILQSTLGTVDAREIRASWLSQVTSNMRAWFDTALAPQFAAVVAMFLVAVIVGTTTMSDDGSIFGMYRTGFRLARESSARGAMSAARNTSLPDEVRRAADRLARSVEGVDGGDDKPRR